MNVHSILHPMKNVAKSCDCGCECSFTGSFTSNGVWVRSLKRKYDEFQRSGRFYIPRVEILSVARVGIENECATLRQTVDSQQKMIQDLCLELEQERNASSSAAKETMSMILRLQNEKAEIQMEARQFKRLSEEKTSHDAQEIAGLEDRLCKKEHAVQSLTCEVQAYKHRIMSYGFTESEADGAKSIISGNASVCSDMAEPVDSPACSYPPLRCNLNSQVPSDHEDEVVDVEKHPSGETPRIQDLKKLEHRINQLGKTPCADQINGEFGSRNVLEKIIVGSSPRRSRHSRRYSVSTPGSLLGSSRDMGPDYVMDSPMWNAGLKKLDSPMWNAGLKKLDCVTEELRKYDSESDYEDDMSDRVYTIDSGHPGAPYNSFSEPKVAAKLCNEYTATPRKNHVDLGDPDVKSLYLRLQALEADRESMRQTIMSMQTDKAQLILLREIAQQYCKNMTPAKPMFHQNPSIAKSFSILAACQWMLSFVLWRKKACLSKYMCDSSANNRGLLSLLDKNPRKMWRCVSSAQAKTDCSGTCSLPTYQGGGDFPSPSFIY